MTSPMILVIDDEPQVRKLLRASLRAEGFRMLEAKSADEGLSLAMQHTPDVVILDLWLPDLDGIEVLKRLRGWSHVPIIVLSARGQESHKVEALDAGADDYLTKPFGIAELLARIRAGLRRSAMSRATEPGGVFTSGGLRVELETRRVFAGEGEVHLTPIEYKILTTLVHHAGRVVTHRHLLEVVWGPKKAEAVDSLRVHITHLRRKLESDPVWPSLILTEAGVGYRLHTGA
jgi:two-component system, OmpR family, KDP operon response regulator KdpE